MLYEHRTFRRRLRQPPRPPVSVWLWVIVVGLVVLALFVAIYLSSPPLAHS